jgi:hypothetical protein
MSQQAIEAQITNLCRRDDPMFGTISELSSGAGVSAQHLILIGYGSIPAVPIAILL